MKLTMFFWISLLACCGLLADEENLPTQTHRVLQFENELVKVWKTIIMPHQPLKMHRHDCARVVVGLKGGTLTKIEEIKRNLFPQFSNRHGVLVSRRSSR